MRTHKHPERVHPASIPSGTVPDPTLADLDPTDPVQQLDEAQDFHVEPLDVNAMPEAERQDDLDAAVELADSDEDDEREDEHRIDDDNLSADERTAELGDVGELYGVHLPPAQDPERGAGPELGEYAEADLGETWLETLEAETGELGPAVEREVDPNDDSDPLGGHHSTESGDRPVADKGSGGPGGL